MTAVQEKDKPHYKLALMARRDEVVSTINKLKESLKDGADVRELTEDGDISQRLEGRTSTLSELKRNEAKLNQIRRALVRFDDDFGYCDECGADIPKARLDFNPATLTCVHCQEVIEKKSRHSVA